MCKKKIKNNGDFDADRDESVWMAGLSEVDYGPAEVKPIKVMIPVSAIYRWFKRRFKK